MNIHMYRYEQYMLMCINTHIYEHLVCYVCEHAHICVHEHENMYKV